MAKYLPIYRCMLCSSLFDKIGQSEEMRAPIEIDEEKVDAICVGAANPIFKSPNLRKRVPYVIAHDCFQDGSYIGTAIFSAFKRVEETEGQG